MIRNDRQLAIARKKRDAALESAASATDPEGQRTYREFAGDVEREIREYLQVRDGKQNRFSVDSLDDVAEALIKARIAGRITQRELAERLGVSEQMVQRDEAGAYAHAKLSRLADVCDALGYRLQGALYPKASDESHPLADVIDLRERAQSDIRRILSATGTDGPKEFSLTPPIADNFFEEERASGLYVAWTAPPQEAGPLDTMVVYITGGELGGRQYSVGEVLGVLESLPRVPTLSLLAALTCHLEHHGPGDREFQFGLADAFCPPAWRRRARELLQDETRVLMSPQTTLALLRLAAGLCRGKGDDVAPHAVGALVLAFADHLTSEFGGEDPTGELALARLPLMFGSGPMRNAWGRSERLWHEIAPSLGDHPRFVDASKVLEEHIGMDVATYAAAAMAIRLLFEEKVRANAPLRQQLPITGPGVDVDVIARYIAAASATPEEVRATEQHQLAWDFTVLRQRPLLRLDDSVIPVSMELLLENGTAGIFYLVEEGLRAQEGERGTSGWRTFFGAVWERYIHRLLEETVGRTDRLVPEADLKGAFPGSSVCDNVVYYPRAWVLVEAVARRMSLPTAVSGGIEDLEGDLHKAVIEKARQLSATVERLSDDPEAALPGVSSGDHVFHPIIVLPGPFPTMTHIVARFREAIQESPETDRLRRDDVRPVVVMEANDFETLLATAVETGETVLDLLVQWQDSDLFDGSFHNWRALNSLPEARTPDWIRNAANRHFERCREILFRRE